MATITRLKENQFVYDVRRARGFRLQKWDVWPIKIIKIDLEKRKVLAQWNYNPEKWYNERQIKKWRVKEPKES